MNCPYCSAENQDNSPVCCCCNASLLNSDSITENAGTVQQSNFQTQSKFEKAVSVVAIIITAVSIVNLIRSLIVYIDFSFELIYIIFSIVSVIAEIIIVIGFIIRKRNKLPGIGYIISAIAYLVYFFADGFFINVTALSVSYFLVLLAALLMTSVLYLSNNNSVRKHWLIPVTLNVIVGVCGFILSSFSVSQNYDFTVVLYELANCIGTVLSGVIVCLNAKVNWNVPETSEQTASLM